MFGMVGMIANTEFGEEDKDYRLGKKIFRISLPLTIISTLLFIFTPSTKQMYMIYGVGGTIEYIKSNDTAKQLPDKCIKALDKLVEEYIGEDNNNK